ncbi:MAG: PadR family transcriptional regulator [Oscillospiraceae bacterium]|nr:PadR family transcriptional regulator [Oscillospiraceae bacterium]
MVFQLGAPLLDACVLAVLAKNDAYGYVLSQEVKRVVDISESTLYPVLRRLQKDDCLTTYDQAVSGRNRRYYSLTEKGKGLYKDYQREWESFKASIDLLLGGNANG